MANELIKAQPVDIVHSFDIWRQITNLILRDVGDIDTLDVALAGLSGEQSDNLVDVINFVYTSTQARLRTVLIKSIGMS